ncbi:hypothetical protein NDA12_002285 [Ustilago hordei]|nr:hypothetical protein NDA12_002285 [Ustilago hordei]KAJ1589454.1 hypothetical protein NDA15_005541 [Ustilago hordei]
MDVMGPLHSATKFTYMLIIHDAHSGMTWAQGLTSKGQASQEAAWWLSEVHIDIHQEPNGVILDQGVLEVCVDQGELWSTAFWNICSLTVVSKHLCPCALWGTYLGFSDTLWAIKGHKVWLLDLNQIVIAKDVCFSKFDQPEPNAPPSHAPILIGDNGLLHSYMWLPPDETNDYGGVKQDNVIQHSLPQFSCQCRPSSQPTSSDMSSYDWEWDCLMAEKEAASKTVVNIDAIAVDLEAELDATQSKRVDAMRESLDTAPLLETPHSDAIADVYNDVSTIEHEFASFTVTCSEMLATTISNHYIDHMAYAVTVMNGTALIASGQQLCSADGILLEPSSLNEAKICDNWYKWQEAMESEMRSMNKMDVFELANVPVDGKLISVCWVFKLKLNAQRQATWYKAQLVAQGLYVTQLDVSTAFLNGKIDKDIYVQILPMFETNETEGKCYKLKKALYSLKQAGCLWHTELDEQLQAFSFKCCRAEPCVYMHGTNNAMILLAIYIDNLLVIRATTSRVQAVRQQLSNVFSITDQGNISHIIGLNVRYDHEAHTLSIDQNGYIEGVLTKFRMSEAWTALTPAMETINSLGPWEADVASTEEVHYYALLVGSLLWIAQGSRPDIAFTVGCCAQFIANPSEEHLAAAKQVLRYLKGTMRVNLTAREPIGKLMLTSWVDSDWAGSCNCHKSTSGYIFAVNGLVCSWLS